MGDKPGNIGDSKSTPGALPGLSASDLGGVSSSNVQDVLHTPVSTLGQLKALLIAKLGEHAGMKLYNSIVTSIGMIMLQQMQESAAHAKRAAQSTRTGYSS